MAEGEWSLPLLTREELADPYSWVTIRGEEWQLWQVGHHFGVTYDLNSSTPAFGTSAGDIRGRNLWQNKAQDPRNNLTTPNGANYVDDNGQFVEPLTCLSGWSGPLAPETPQHSSAHDEDSYSPRVREMMALIDELVDEAWLLQVGEEGSNDAIAETEAILTGTVPEGGWASLYPRPLSTKPRPRGSPSRSTMLPLRPQQQPTGYGGSIEEAAPSRRTRLTGTMLSPQPTDGMGPAERPIISRPASRRQLGAREPPTLAPRETAKETSAFEGRGGGQRLFPATRPRQVPSTTSPPATTQPPHTGSVAVASWQLAGVPSTQQVPQRRAVGRATGDATPPPPTGQGPSENDRQQDASPAERWPKPRKHKPVATSSSTPGAAAAPISILKRNNHDGGAHSSPDYSARPAQHALRKSPAASDLLPYPLPSFLQHPPSFLQHPPEFHQAQARVGAREDAQPATPRSPRAKAGAPPPARPVTPTAAGGDHDPGLVSRWSPDSSDSPRPSRLKKVKKALSFASLRLRARKSGVFRRQAGDRAEGPEQPPAGTRTSGSSGGSSSARGGANRGGDR